MPDVLAPKSDALSRWSDSGWERPALVVIPNSAEDIIGVISYAENNGLRVIPAGGGHGSFVPVDANTVYVDLNKFDSIVLDKGNEFVQFGGGVLAGALLKKCTDEGF